MNLNFFAPMAITLLSALVVAVVYYHRFHKKDVATAIAIYSLFTFCIVYFVSFDQNIGLGIGLLGVLSLIRLRSTPENLIDISFIFYAITIGLLGASIHSLQTIALLNILLASILLLLTWNVVFRHNTQKVQITLDELVSNPEQIRKVLRKKYKIEAQKITILKLDELKDATILEISHDQADN